ncbi:NAC domain-containing protein JA2L-like [Primulina huaijiensis]|uniref:NAC domain-containing protein JA2L-like n=1 Tax=Primulina huaijiensis TaxID=1492673 RepID=UPI003CC790C4
MCPPVGPSSPAEIGQLLNDEQCFLWLDRYSRGFSLPTNVLADMTPFQYHPSNLPEGIWYLVDANEKKDSVYGFWKDKGEACEIYSNSSIFGWRASLEYFEGQAPYGQRTDWLMHEHKITQKEPFYKDKPKESRSLCKVFLCKARISENESHSSQNSKTVVGSKPISMASSIIPDINSTSLQDSKNESKAKPECDAGLLPLTDITSNFSPRDWSELECLSRGDYLELNDLQDDPESNFSSSQNSTCPSKLSEEYFDSLGLLQDLEEEGRIKTKENPLSSRCHFTHSVESDRLIIQPPSSGSALSVGGSTSGNERLTATLENTAKRHISDTRDEGPSNFSDSSSSPSASHTNASSDGEKKTSPRARSGRMKKLKRYCCFKPL